MGRSRAGGREGYPHSPEVNIRKFTEAQRIVISFIGTTSAVLSDRSRGNPESRKREVNQEVAERLCKRGYVALDGNGNAMLTEDGLKVHAALYPWLHDEEFMAKHPSWKEV